MWLYVILFILLILVIMKFVSSYTFKQSNTKINIKIGNQIRAFDIEGDYCYILAGDKLYKYNIVNHEIAETVQALNEFNNIRVFGSTIFIQYGSNTMIYNTSDLSYFGSIETKHTENIIGKIDDKYITLSNTNNNICMYNNGLNGDIITYNLPKLDRNITPNCTSIYDGKIYTYTNSLNTLYFNTNGENNINISKEKIRMPQMIGNPNIVRVKDNKIYCAQNNTLYVYDLTA